MKSRGSQNFWMLLGAVSSIFLSLFLGACETTPTYSPEEAPEMIVVSDFAPFYSMGPKQMMGPDASLRLDAVVKLIRREFGYSYVQLEDGRFGYMPSQTIQPAPPQAPVAPATQPAGGGAAASASQFYSVPPVDDFTLPDFDLMPLEIPPPILLDDEESIVKPEFRL